MEKLTAVEFMDELETLCHKRGFEMEAIFQDVSPYICIRSDDDEVRVDFIIGDKRGKE